MRRGSASELTMILGYVILFFAACIVGAVKCTIELACRILSVAMIAFAAITCTLFTLLVLRPRRRSPPYGGSWCGSHCRL